MFRFICFDGVGFNFDPVLRLFHRFHGVASYAMWIYYTGLNRLCNIFGLPERGAENQTGAARQGEKHGKFQKRVWDWLRGCSRVFNRRDYLDGGWVIRF